MTPFRTLTAFLLLSILGICSLFFLPTRITHFKGGNIITIQFSWPSATADVVEEEVTSKIEGCIETFEGVLHITSSSSDGGGGVYATFGNDVNIRNMRYEISCVIKQLYGSLPQGVSYPVININGNISDRSSELVMSYTIVSADSSSESIEKWFTDSVRPTVLKNKGIQDIVMSNINPYQIKIKIKPGMAEALQLSAKDIAACLNTNLAQSELGQVKYRFEEGPEANTLYALVRTNPSDNISEWKRMSLKIGSRNLAIGDLADITYNRQAPTYYSRCNGFKKNVLSIYAGLNQNYFDLVEKISSTMELQNKNIPKGVFIKPSYNAKEVLGEELKQVLNKTILTVGILLLLIFYVTRSFQYLLLILITLIVNVFISFIFFYLFSIDIEPYSMVGIAVSIGMIIDGTIVVIEHIRTQNNNKIFLALTGAHFTSIGSVSIIFFIKNVRDLSLFTFGLVVIINLMISLFVAYFLVPTLVHYLRISSKKTEKKIEKRRRLIKRYTRYNIFIDLIVGNKIKAVVIVVLLFGLPVSLIPRKIEANNFFCTSYNNFMDSQTGQEYRTYLDYCLGGTLRLFLKPGYNFDDIEQNKKAELKVNLHASKGTPITYINESVTELEATLCQFKELDEFTSEVVNGESANIQISFKPEYCTTSFPLQLKEELQTVANQLGAVDVEINGVGRGFSNRLSDEYGNYSVSIKGFNYNELKRITNDAKKFLGSYPRVSKIYIDDEKYSASKKGVFYAYTFNNLTDYIVSEKKINTLLFKQDLDYLASEETIVTSSNVNGVKTNVVISPTVDTPNRLWDVLNYPVRLDSARFLKLHKFIKSNKEIIPGVINKNDQEYALTINYSAIADIDQATEIKEKLETELKKHLPIGYSIIIENVTTRSNLTNNSLTIATFVSIAIIFFISAIFLNSLKQSFGVIVMIPISFIGVFVSKYLLGLQLDEGVYASFIVLSGLVVNWALFILNDFNAMATSKNNVNKRLIYKKALQNKIIPIFLSVSSCIIGMLPFLINSAGGEHFWYSLAVCCISGLLFSIIGTFILLPIFL